MLQYQVIANPGIDGISIGDVMQQVLDMPYQNLNNPGAWVASDIVENNPQWFQLST